MLYAQSEHILHMTRGIPRTGARCNDTTEPTTRDNEAEQWRTQYSALLSMRAFLLYEQVDILEGPTRDKRSFVFDGLKQLVRLVDIDHQGIDTSTCNPNFRPNCYSFL